MVLGDGVVRSMASRPRAAGSRGRGQCRRDGLRLSRSCRLRPTTGRRRPSRHLPCLASRLRGRSRFPDRPVADRDSTRHGRGPCRCPGVGRRHARPARGHPDVESHLYLDACQRTGPFHRGPVRPGPRRPWPRRPWRRWPGDHRAPRTATPPPTTAPVNSTVAAALSARAPPPAVNSAMWEPAPSAARRSRRAAGRGARRGSPR